MNKALFLDRDGIINIEKNYLYRIEDFEFINETVELMRKAQNRGYLLIVVSNQAGIAKGKFMEKDFQILNQWMIKELESKGIKITDSLYCPYHKEGIVPEYRKDSFDRKPNPGMILNAIKKYQIDPQESYLLGDRFSDIIAGYKANVKKLFLLEKEYSYRDYQEEDFQEIVYSKISIISDEIIVWKLIITESLDKGFEKWYYK